MSTQVDIDLYAAGFKKRVQERRATFESERINLLAKVRLAGPALKALGAKEVIIFGSILRPGFFDRASDIDILVIGLPDEHLWKALGVAERSTGIIEREINLTFDQMASPDFVTEARTRGIIL
jgi:predicted nucleotidyltransferase